MVILDKDSINAWLGQDIDKLPMQELVNYKSKEVIAPLIPRQITEILPTFLRLLDRRIFKQEFERRVCEADGKELAAVVPIHEDAVNAYNRVIQTIAEGTTFLSYIMPTINMIILCIII